MGVVLGVADGVGVGVSVDVAVWVGVGVDDGRMMVVAVGVGGRRTMMLRGMWVSPPLDVMCRAPE